jgi:hypothetical protein
VSRLPTPRPRRRCWSPALIPCQSIECAPRTVTCMYPPADIYMPVLTAWLVPTTFDPLDGPCPRTYPRRTARLIDVCGAHMCAVYVCLCYLVCTPVGLMARISHKQDFSYNVVCMCIYVCQGERVRIQTSLGIGWPRSVDGNAGSAHIDNCSGIDGPNQPQKDFFQRRLRDAPLAYARCASPSTISACGRGKHCVSLYVCVCVCVGLCERVPPQGCGRVPLLPLSKYCTKDGKTSSDACGTWKMSAPAESSSRVMPAQPHRHVDAERRVKIGLCQMDGLWAHTERHCMIV